MSVEITPELLEGLRGKAEDAGSGTWYQNDEFVFEDLSNPPRRDLIADCSSNREYSLPTAIYIAAANPAVVLALVAEIERQRKALMAIHELERKRWESAVKAFRTIPGELLMENRNERPDPQ